MRDTQNSPELAQRASTRRRANTVEIIKTEVTGPLVFASQPVPRVWGGRALSDLLGHDLPTGQPYGETWDISDLTEHVSRVSDGPHRGKSLIEIWKSHRTELISSSAVKGADFPLLIKWLDCHDWLSVQVHPDDAMAREVLDQPYGKSEAWIVLHSDPTARVYAGLLPGVTRKELSHHLKEGSAHECLHSFSPQMGDCIVLPAGTIHAAGGGLVMAEVQQSSNATFRLFDWNRLGLDGNPRPLQIELGLDAIDWNQGAISPTIPLPIHTSQSGVRGEIIANLHAFTIERFTLRQPWTAPYPGEFAIWMVLDGSVNLTVQETGERRELRRGRTVMIPAATGAIDWSPIDPESETTLICVRLPVSLV